MAKKGSKNNIENRGTGAQLKSISGKTVIPVMYYGKNAGHGQYIAAEYSDNGNLVLDKSGKPIPYDRIQ